MDSKNYCGIFIFCIFIILFPPLNSSGQVINVPADLSTIQAAIDSAETGDTVLVAEGVYYENLNFNSKAITLASRFIIDGDTAHISRTIIDGSKPSHPDSGSVVTMWVSDTTSVLSGFTIIGGSGELDSVVIGSNKSVIRRGGGINGSGGKIESCYITGNEIKSSGATQAVGGGICMWPDPREKTNIVIRGNRIYSNSVTGQTFTQGAGILSGCEDGYTLVENNEVYDNSATCTSVWKANAGGIMLASQVPWRSRLIVRNNRIRDNHINCTAAQGAGIFLTFPPYRESYRDFKTNIEIYNNLITGNTSSDAGGGIAVWNQNQTSWESPSLVISNNTISGNRAEKGRGAGIFNYNMQLLMFNNILCNELIEDNSAEVFKSDYSGYSNKGEFLSYNNVIQNGSSSRWDIGGSPGFLNGDYDLCDTSLCIDRGTDSIMINGYIFTAPDFDFHYLPRPFRGNNNPGVDVGAVESENSIFDHFTMTVDTSVIDTGDCKLTLAFVVEGGVPPFRYYVNGDEYITNSLEELCGGEYVVSVMDTTGASLTQTFYYIPSGEPRYTLQPEISLFPNPVSDYFHLKGIDPSLHNNLRIIITRVDGRVVEQKTITNELKIYVRGFEPGLYFISVFSRSKYLGTLRFIKE